MKSNTAFIVTLMFFVFFISIVPSIDALSYVVPPESTPLAEPTISCKNPPMCPAPPGDSCTYQIINCNCVLYCTNPTLTNTPILPPTPTTTYLAPTPTNTPAPTARIAPTDTPKPIVCTTTPNFDTNGSTDINFYDLSFISIRKGKDPSTAENTSANIFCDNAIDDKDIQFWIKNAPYMDFSQSY